jgi:hypothetical protein
MAPSKFFILKAALRLGKHDSSPIASKNRGYGIKSPVIFDYNTTRKIEIPIKGRV